MTQAASDSNLGMLLPMRSHLDLAEYMQLLMAEFPESLPFSETNLCQMIPAEAVILSTHPEDPGHPYRILGCDQDTNDMILTPERQNLLGDDAYCRAIIFIEARRHIFMGLSAFKHSRQENWLFSQPATFYRRRTRQNKRVRIDGNILLRHRDGRTTLARLHDFSPSGASFYTNKPLPVGETLLAEFEVLGCGTCETVITTAREESLLSDAPCRYLIGIKMQLTTAQRQKAEQLCLCKKAGAMKNIVDSARSRNGQCLYIR